MTGGDLVLYQTEDGRAEIQLRAMDGTVWLRQGEIAALFDTSKQNLSLHIRNILGEGELAGESVVKESLTTAADGKAYRTKMFSRDSMTRIAHDRYTAYDSNRKDAEAEAAEVEYEEELRAIEAEVTKKISRKDNKT